MFVFMLFLLLGSGSKFPEVDPDPAKWYGSNRIRIRNTDFQNTKEGLDRKLNNVLREYLEFYSLVN